MIPMTMVGKVRRMFHRQNKSVREIARLTSLSRNTISKYLNMDVQEEPKYQLRSQPTRLTPFHEALVQALSADARRPKKERRTAWMLFQEIRASDYDGCYSRVTDFIRAWRQGEGKAVSKSAFVPLRFELGEAFQFDWSEEGLVVGGIYRKLQVSHMKLCASRAFWLVAYPSQGHEMLFDAQTRSFAAFGGVVRRGIYDNMKTAADKVHKGKGRTVSLTHITPFVDRVVPRERIGMQCSPEVLQMGLWMFAGSCGTVREPDCRLVLRAGRPVIPNVRPETCSAGLPIAGLAHRYRRVIRVDLRGCHHVTANNLYEWPEQRTALADPVRECRTAEFHAVARIDH
nr:hypothetical protein HUO10_005423 [Paraburkholderia busanensis]